MLAGQAPAPGPCRQPLRGLWGAAWVTVAAALAGRVRPAVGRRACSGRFLQTLLTCRARRSALCPQPVGCRLAVRLTGEVSLAGLGSGAPAGWLPAGGVASCPPGQPQWSSITGRLSGRLWSGARARLWAHCPAGSGQPDAAFLSDHVWPGHASGLCGPRGAPVRPGGTKGLRPLLCSWCRRRVLHRWHLLQSWDGAVEKEPGLESESRCGVWWRCRGPLRACGGRGWRAGWPLQCAALCRASSVPCVQRPSVIVAWFQGWSRGLEGELELVPGPQEPAGRGLALGRALAPESPCERPSVPVPEDSRVSGLRFKPDHHRC